MKKSVLYILLFMLCISATGCARRHSITIAGSSAFQSFAEQLATDYMKIYPQANINVQGGGSAVGIQATVDGTAQIGMADLVTLPETAKELKKFVVANDGICLAVHPSNTVSNLSLEQIRSIYSGKIKNWKEVGGADKTITVVSREAGSGTRSSFEDLVLKDLKLTGDAVIGNSNGTMRETVINDPNAIGYISYGVLNDKVKPIKIDGVVPDCENIISGKYKLVRPIYLLTRKDADTEVYGIINYILGSEGQKTITSEGLMPASLCIIK